MSDPSDKAIAPCPFCGGAAMIGPWGDAVAAGHEYATAIECTSDLYECPVNPAVCNYTVAETVAGWNRRTPPAQAAEAVGRVIGTTQGDGWWRYEVSGEGLEPGLGGCHISMKPAGSVAKPATMTMTDALAVMHDAALRLRSKGCTEFAADLDAARAAIAAIQARE